MGYSNAETKKEIEYWHKTLMQEKLVLQQFYYHAGINDSAME
jgi:hypothetical protein